MRMVWMVVVVVIVVVGLASGVSGSARAVAPTDATIEAFGTRVAELEGTVAALTTRVAEINPNLGTPTPGGAATQADALLMSLLESPWAGETATMGLEVVAAQIVASPTGDTDLNGAVGGVSVRWPAQPLSVGYLVFDTTTAADAARAEIVAEAIAAGAVVSTVGSGEVDGSCLGPPEVLPGSPDQAVCLAVLDGVLVMSMGDDHDASRVAFLLLEALRHLETVQAG